MKPELLVDTTVALTANGDATHASLRCQMACIDALERVMGENILLLDIVNAIINEYLLQNPYKDYP